MFRQGLSSLLHRISVNYRPGREVWAALQQSTTATASSPCIQVAAFSLLHKNQPCDGYRHCMYHTSSPQVPFHKQSIPVKQEEENPMPSLPRYVSLDEKWPVWVKDPTSPTGLSVAAVQANNEAQNNWLEVSWEDGTKSEYPYLWLRDNCACPDCFHPPSLCRLFLMKNLDVNIKPTSITVDSQEKRIYIKWSDGHLGSYPWSWLEGRSFAEKTAKQRQKWLPRQPTLWDGELQNNIPTDTFDNIMSSDKALYNWITTIEQTGLFKVKDAPEGEGQLVKIAQRIAFLKNTHLGEVWDVCSRTTPDDLAYTKATLNLHTDLVYYDYTPGVTILHCIKQTKSEGGENQFADGFYITERMRIEYPDYYKLLTEAVVDYIDLGKEIKHRKYFKLKRQPIIQLDHDGRYDRITYNNVFRDSVLLAPVEVVNELYKAMKTFDAMLQDPKIHIVYKMSPGDIICFHNYRVLHGRSGYNELEAGDRFLQGGFLDWDEVSCRRRVLQMDLGIEE